MDRLIALRAEWKGRQPTPFAREWESELVRQWRVAIDWYRQTIDWGREIRQKLRRFDAEAEATPVTSACARPS